MFLNDDEKNRLMEVLDKHEMTMYTSQQGKELVSEIEFYSDLGEDFIMSIFWDGTQKGFAEAIASYSEGFDPYEHACVYIGMSRNDRERMQVPDSNAALMKDALKIKKKIQAFSKELNRQYKTYKKGA